LPTIKKQRTEEERNTTAPLFLLPFFAIYRHENKRNGARWVFYHPTQNKPPKQTHAKTTPRNFLSFRNFLSLYIYSLQGATITLTQPPKTKTTEGENARGQVVGAVLVL
jgi:hypothetical protein